MKTCFFIGHRDAPQELLPQIESAVERMVISEGVTHFLVGHYGNFDRMAAEAVIRTKKRHRSVMLHMLLPYRTASRMEHLPEGFNGVFCPFDTAPAETAAIPVANKYAISHCDHLIAWSCHEGNARGFVEYALSWGKIAVINLADQQEISAPDQ